MIEAENWCEFCYKPEPLCDCDFDSIDEAMAEEE